jgi:hypothetical protein
VMDRGIVITGGGALLKGPGRATAARDRHARSTSPTGRWTRWRWGRQVRRGVRGTAAGADLRAAALGRWPWSAAPGLDEQGHPTHPGAARAAAHHLHQPDHHRLPRW